MLATFEGAYPYMAEIATEHVMQPGYDFGDEFEIGRELVLDALETLCAGVDAEPIGHGGGVADLSTWLLSASERGNPRTRLDDLHPGEQAWSSGNRVRALVHGATYFAELFERLEATRDGRPGALHRLAGRRRRAPDR